jgi:hypothetical protein
MIAEMDENVRVPVGTYSTSISWARSLMITVT